MGILFFALGIAVLGISVYFAFKKRYNMAKCIASITLGIFFATFFMILGTEWVKAGKTVENPTLYSVVSSVLYSFKALGGRQDISQLETVGLEGFLKTLYVIINYAMFILAPVLASSLVLSFIGDVGDKIRYFFVRANKCYVFSEINDNSLALAKGISKQTKKVTLIFCKTKDANKEAVAKAREIGAILLYKGCDGIKLFKKFREYEFCLISNQEDNNLKLAEQVVDKFNNESDVKIIVNAFIESGTNVRFLEKALKNKKNDKMKLELRCVDEIALFCNNLIFNYPLYNTNGNGNNISVAIVGCGRVGMRMLKTAFWAGQIDGYTLKIRVYDEKADRIREEFYKQCPGLLGNPAIAFVTADVNTLDFRNKLLDEENSLDATYVVVAMGDDQQNVTVSDEIYKLYRISRGFDDERIPEIFTRVRSQIKTNSYFDNTQFLFDRHIHLFGTTESMFSNKTLFNTELENMAFAVHLAYWDRLDAKEGSQEYLEVRRDFETSEYDRRSSMATALHIPAKLHACLGAKAEDGAVLTEENVKEFSKKIKEDKELLKRLAMNEHDRWNAFMLSEGYQKATKEQMLLYSAKTGDHKDNLSMLHPCITDWDSLDEIEKIFNQVSGKNKKFKYYDEKIVASIPKIWEVAQKRNGDN
ncbi:MAG: hypothetical protein IKB86_00745 [Clostridia bacterium]|nr:hypothetical protein [Clostridia bacterium]